MKRDMNPILAQLFRASLNSWSVTAARAIHPLFFSTAPLKIETLPSMRARLISFYL
jgi:hypothetical protein